MHAKLKYLVSMFVTAGLLLLGGTVLPSPSYSFAAADSHDIRQGFELFDQTFILDHWAEFELVFYAGSYSLSNRLTGGNPGAYLELFHDVPLPPSDIPNPVGMHIGYFNVHQPYDPAVHGPLTSMDISLDIIRLNDTLTQGTDSSIALVQNGIVFLPSQFFGFNTAEWTNLSYSNLKEDDFTSWYVPDYELDFSENGLPIFFGFVRNSAETINTVSTATPRQFGIDNFHITIPSGLASQPMADLRVAPQSPTEVKYINVAETSEIILGLPPLTVHNDGPSRATDVALNYRFVDTDFFVETTSLPSARCEESAETENITCRLEDIASSAQSSPVSISRTYSPQQDVPYFGTVQVFVTASANEIDPTPDNAVYAEVYEIFHCQTQPDCPAEAIFCSDTFFSRRRDVGSDSVHPKIDITGR